VWFLEQPIERVETAHYLGVTLDTRRTWSELVKQMGKKATKRLNVLGPLLTRKSVLSVRRGVLIYRQLIVPSGRSLPAATSGSCKFYNPSAFELRLTHLGVLVTGKFTKIWRFHSSLTTSER
jgi:hypothetical protein